MRALRQILCLPRPEIQTAARAWRTVQVRQAFRLALEAFLHWILRHLGAGPRTTAEYLAEIFVSGAGEDSTTEKWLNAAVPDNTGPADWVDRLEKSLMPFDDEIELMRAIRHALAMSLSEASDRAGTERDDRLPLARAAKEARDWKEQTPRAVHRACCREAPDFWTTRVLVSRARSLADARGRGKTAYSGWKATLTPKKMVGRWRRGQTWLTGMRHRSLSGDLRLAARHDDVIARGEGG